MPRIKATALLLSLATLSVPALAQGTNPAVRDSYSALNYVQGQATLDGQPVTTSPTATPRILHPGETLTTTDGTADVMLVPGTLLRLGQNTTAQIVAGTSGHAEARVESGRANVAVNALAPKSLVLVDLPNGQTQLLKRGLYTFDVPTETVRVFNGEANAFAGANTTSNVKPVKVKDGREVLLGDARLHPAKFDEEAGQGDLLPWTGSQEAHSDGYYGLSNGGGANYTETSYDGGYGYSPYAAGFGYGFGYPIGYGFGSPYGYGYPFGFGYGYGLGYPFGGVGFYGYRGGYYGGRSVLGGRGLREGGYAGGFARGYASGGYRGGAGFSGGGFHSGGFGGGGFHSSGGGGFHGGGGGGFHGGGGGGHR